MSKETTKLVTNLKKETKKKLRLMAAERGVGMNVILEELINKAKES